MQLIIAVLAGLSATMIIIGVIGVIWGKDWALNARLEEIQRQRSDTTAAQQARLRTEQRQEQLRKFLENIGGWIAQRARMGLEDTQNMLLQAGYRYSQGAAVFLAFRVLLTLTLVLLGMGVAGAGSGITALLWPLIGGMFGWILPNFYIKRKGKKRKQEIRRTLPDMLDLLVVCVEAGLGLTQAFQRVTQEMKRISPVFYEELSIMMMQLQTGSNQEEAFRDLARRTQVDDLRSLSTMVIQTMKFGTSISRTLRVFSDTLREKRQQEGEEQASKASIKIMIPLVLFVMPAVFVVILGPSMFYVMSLIEGF